MCPSYEWRMITITIYKNRCLQETDHIVMRDKCCCHPCGPCGPWDPCVPCGPCCPLPPGPPVPPPPPGMGAAALAAHPAQQTVASGNDLDLGGIVKSVGGGISLTAPDTITVAPGAYLLHFSCVASGTVSCGPLAAGVSVNGTVIPTATCSFYAGNDPSMLVLQHLFTAAAPTRLTIRNISSAPLKYSDTALSVLRL